VHCVRPAQDRTVCPFARVFDATLHSYTAGLLASTVRSPAAHPICAACRRAAALRWTADPERNKSGRDLGYTRYDQVAQAFDCYADTSKSPRTSARPCSAPGARSRGDGRLYQRQDRLPRPRHNRALLQPRDLSGRRLKKRGACRGPFFSRWKGFAPSPALALLRPSAQSHPRVKTLGVRDARIRVDGGQRRAIDRDEYIEVWSVLYRVGSSTV
jgi:hypothetical protein